MLGYDAENRLVNVTGGVTASFVYDGDGNCVKGVITNGPTITYIGNFVEWVNGAPNPLVKYYYASSERVSMRECPVPGTCLNNKFILGDHLGSTSITTDNQGLNPTELRYYAWGGVRYSSGTIPTSFRFIGQRWEAVLTCTIMAPVGMTVTGRFVQADSVIPNPTNSQAWDRYAYSSGNPVKYIDPTGHYGEEIHRDLTYQIVHDAAMNIADEMGFGLKELKAFADSLSTEVARGDMAADSLNLDGTWNPGYTYMNSLTPPIYIKIGCTTLVDAKSPSWYTTPESAEALNNARDPFEFGIASHEYQDSISHWQKLGEPETPIQTWFLSGVNAATEHNIIDQYDINNPIDRAMTYGYTGYAESFVQSQVDQWRFYGH